MNFPPDTDPMIMRYASLAMHFAHKANSKHHRANLQELEQAALIGLWKALRGRKEGDRLVDGYVATRINGEIIDYIRSESMFPRRLYRTFTQTSFSEEAMNSALVSDGGINAVEVQELLEKGEKFLSEREREAFNTRYAKDMKMKTLGRRFGLGEASMSMAKLRAERKLRELAE